MAVKRKADLNVLRKRTVSEEGKRKISEAQSKRWARDRKEK